MKCHHSKCHRTAAYLPVIPITSRAYLVPLFYVEQMNRPTCKKHTEGDHRLTNEDIQACRNAFDEFKRVKNLHPMTQLNTFKLHIQFNKTKFH